MDAAEHDRCEDERDHCTHKGAEQASEEQIDTEIRVVSRNELYLFIKCGRIECAVVHTAELRVDPLPYFYFQFTGSF